MSKSKGNGKKTKATHISRIEAFNANTVLALLDERTKAATGEGLQLTKNAKLMATEFLSAFLSEALSRAAFKAQEEGAEEVDVTHLEKVLPQLLLDF